MKKALRAAYRYFLFFALVALLASCVVSLFVTVFAKDLDVTLTDENISRAAKSAFVCVVLLSFLVTVIDVVRRKLTTERITKRIAVASSELIKGNFDVRIPPVEPLVADSNYNNIIDSFNKMAQELAGLETLRTDFVANVSHEMKTPLAVMRNYATLLQAPDLPSDKRTEYAKGISDAAHRMSDMITNILKLNRLENQSIYPRSERIDLGEQLCECLLQYENVWETRSITVQTDIAQDVVLSADGELLMLVWNNLLSNAFKFTPDGGTVGLILSADENCACVTVKDTGCGMSGEVGKHIFEKFYQGDTSHATQGNGLGLALVKRVVDIMKGEISVESEVGIGSAFTVKLRR